MNDSEDGVPQMLGIGLANLSSGSHGTFTFSWLLDPPGVDPPAGTSQEAGQPFGFMKKMEMILLLLLSGGRS